MKVHQCISFAILLCLALHAKAAIETIDTFYELKYSGAPPNDEYNPRTWFSVYLDTSNGKVRRVKSIYKLWDVEAANTKGNATPQMRNMIINCDTLNFDFYHDGTESKPAYLREKAISMVDNHYTRATSSDHASSRFANLLCSYLAKLERNAAESEVVASGDARHSPIPANQEVSAGVGESTGNSDRPNSSSKADATTAARSKRSEVSNANLANDEKNDSGRQKLKTIPLRERGGVFEVKATLNSEINVYFVVDSGAADLTISEGVARILIENESLTRRDVVGKANYSVADGRVSVGTIIRIKTFDLGGVLLKDVRAVVMSGENAPLLMGQSVLKRLGRWSLDASGKQLLIRQ